MTKNFLNGINVRGKPICNFVFTVPGTATVGVGVTPWVAPRDGVVRNVILACGTAPGTQSLIGDVNKNGTTIFTTQGNRPTITAGTTKDTSSVPDVTAFSAGDVFTCDIDQIGSGPAGAEVVFMIEYD